jgi:organic radical activating enzyme
MIHKYRSWLNEKSRYKDIYPSGHLNVGKYRNGLLSEGEGLNFEIFTQGCQRFCRGCRNGHFATMKLANSFKIEKLADIVVDHQCVPVHKEDAVTNVDLFLEKIFLLLLEYQLMLQRETTLHVSPFPDVPLPHFMRAWQAKMDTLNRLGFYLMHMSNAPSDIRGSSIPITGVTLCGGEPLYQLENVLAFVHALRERLQLKIWIMTGFVYEDIIRYEAPRALLAATDFLIDGAFVLSRTNLAHPYRGSTNQRVIDVKRSLQEERVVLWSPQYRWTQLFIPYWEKFSDVRQADTYHGFVSSKEVYYYVKEVKQIRSLFSVSSYEKQFGDIRERFVSHVLRST